MRRRVEHLKGAALAGFGVAIASALFWWLGWEAIWFSGPGFVVCVIALVGKLYQALTDK